jgi:hypothetical protein
MPGPQDPRGSEMQAPGTGPRIDPGTDHSFSLLFLSTHISARAASYKLQVVGQTVQHPKSEKALRCCAVHRRQSHLIPDIVLNSTINSPILLFRLYMSLWSPHFPHTSTKSLATVAQHRTSLHLHLHLHLHLQNQSYFFSPNLPEYT